MAKANQTINVRTWSKTVPSYGLRLSDLDLYVLRNHDDVLRALGHERVEGPTRLRERGLIEAAEAAQLELLPLGASTTIAPAGASPRQL